MGINNEIRQGLAPFGQPISRKTVNNILATEVIAPPDNNGDSDNCGSFTNRDAEAMLQCKFACKEKWTITGMARVYFILFTDLANRRLWVSLVTENPTVDWNAQQARTV